MQFLILTNRCLYRFGETSRDFHDKDHKHICYIYFTWPWNLQSLEKLGKNAAIPV